MERNYTSHRDIISTPSKSDEPQTDAALLQNQEALEIAWQCEINAWIALKRSGTADALATAAAARQATQAIVHKIDAHRAVTRQGRSLKTRTAQWRRYGGSFGHSQSAQAL